MSDNGLVTRASVLDELDVQTPFMHGVSGYVDASAPMVINPNRPISSLAMGGGQFTIARDINHGNPDITGAILSELDGLAQAGVKHIMFESISATKVEMEAVYPELKDMSPKQAGDFFNAAYKQVAEHVSGQIVPKIAHITNMDEWKIAYEKEQDILYKTPEIKDVMDQLVRFESSFLTQDVIEEWFSEPAEMSEDELRTYAHLFRNINATNDADREAIAENRIEIMIKCKELGITLHDFGDDPGIEHWNKYYALNEKIDDIAVQKDAYIQENAELNKVFKTWIKEDPSYFDRLTVGLTDSEKVDTLDSLTSHGNKLNDFFNMSTKAHDDASIEMGLATQARFSDDALERRAQKYIDMAGGDKTLIFRGAAHFNNTETPNMDVDEYLDQKLRQQALQDGTLNDFNPIKQITLYPSRDAQVKSAKIMGRDVTPPDPSDLNYFIKDGAVEITAEYKGQYIIMHDENALNNTLVQ